MILKINNESKLFEDIKQNDKKVIIYGAGMVGQIVMPYLVCKYGIHSNIDCFVDADSQKVGNNIVISGISYKINSIDYLKKNGADKIILVTNTKFMSIIEFLNSIDTLNNSEVYIVPMMLLEKADNSEDIAIVHREKKQLIPKKINYCWFGGNNMPDFLVQCIESWKRLCPDYEIIEWSEKNYDIKRHKYTYDAYKNAKYGFVSDVARLDILYENGGLYLDTDVTLLKKPDDLLYQQGFMNVEKWGNINSGGGCGFAPKNKMVRILLEYRDKFEFIRDNGTLDLSTNGIFETKIFLDKGYIPNNKLQVIEGITVYPSYIAHPYDYMSGEIKCRENTISIHHFYGGWMEKTDLEVRQKTKENYKKVLNMIK